MGTNLSIDSGLLDEALHIGDLSTEKDTVNQALKEFIERRRQREMVASFGHLPPDGDYDYKQGRK